SSTSTRFFSCCTSFSSARRRSSGACAAARLHANARSSAKYRSERIANACGNALRVASARRRSRADAVLAEVAQPAHFVPDLGHQGDDVEVAIEDVLVG